MRKHPPFARLFAPSRQCREGCVFVCATSFKYFRNNVRASARRRGRRGEEKKGRVAGDRSNKGYVSMFGPILQLSLLWHEIDNGTVQMTFLACIPAASHRTIPHRIARSCTILHRGGPISKRFPLGARGTLKIIAATEFALLWAPFASPNGHGSCGAYESLGKRWITFFLQPGPNIIRRESTVALIVARFYGRIKRRGNLACRHGDVEITQKRAEDRQTAGIEIRDAHCVFDSAKNWSFN